MEYLKFIRRWSLVKIAELFNMSEGDELFYKTDIKKKLNIVSPRAI
jgi:hypothetical protein